MFQKTRTYKGVWRYLIKDGHEHITSCLFLLVSDKRFVGGSRQEREEYVLTEKL